MPVAGPSRSSAGLNGRIVELRRKGIGERKKTLACLLGSLTLLALAGPASGNSTFAEAGTVLPDSDLAAHVGAGKADCALALIGLGLSVPAMGAGFVGALGFSFSLHMAALNCI